MAQQVFVQHRQTKSMVTNPVAKHGRKKSHGPRSRSGSLSSNQTPSPSPLRNAQYTRPHSGYEDEHMQYQQPMPNAAYAPISSAESGDDFADHYNAYPGLPRQYSQREEMEYLKDVSRRGSTMDFGSNRA
ncbi:hypothetical protein QFC20_002388 [Naganishia adeliensis]|uniref:Uncharacterized protein n=1 Tax=Naganishia adeliensis TaxID=92952 RepID=A0ACC2WKN8_9TREE|nr:hypothetical protein QFC20_002388 [Naganishia adeliensis]